MNALDNRFVNAIRDFVKHEPPYVPKVIGHAHFPLEKVGTKQQSLKHLEEAYKLFNQAYDLYCLFWGLNMNMIDVSDVKWIEDKSADVNAVCEHLEQTGTQPAESEPQTGAFGKMKSFVRKAVDCCIE